MTNNWILIGLLSVSTYVSRIIGIEAMIAKNMRPVLRSYFSYVPIGIMAALVTEQVVARADGHMTASMPGLAGCLSTAIAARATKRFLPSVAVGAIVGWAVCFVSG